MKMLAMGQNYIRGIAMSKEPELLFKYRKLSSETELERCIDIVAQKRLYFPTIDKLNDRLEAASVDIRLPVAGYQIAVAAERTHPIVEGVKQRFHVLSLSENCFSSQLWGYYTDYTGICFCFKNEGVFRQAKPICYTSQIEETRPKNLAEMAEDIRTSLFRKQLGWEREQEWRIVEETQERFFSFPDGILAAVIIGDRTPNKLLEPFLQCLPSNLSIFTTYPCMFSGCLGAIPADYVDRSGGERLPVITTVDELAAILKNG